MVDDRVFHGAAFDKLDHFGRALSYDTYTIQD